MSSTATIRAIRCAFPSGRLTNEELSPLVLWEPAKIEMKTGVVTRTILEPDRTAADLAYEAAKQILDDGIVPTSEIDFLILCTQSPDYFLPTTACILQDRLGLPTTCGALDFNLGCSGFIYGLGMAKGLIETGQAKNILLVTADAYSKFIHDKDRSVRTIFGDAGAATLIQASPEPEPAINHFVYGTDGKGAKNLIVPTGGMKAPRTEESAKEWKDQNGNVRTGDSLFMNGPEIFNFTMGSVPPLVAETLRKADLAMDDIDLFVFHQANAYMLEGLRSKINIPPEKFIVRMRDCGNTVSATIPIALEAIRSEGAIKPGQKIMLVGFGVGYSWGACIWNVSRDFCSSS